jgi:hypothetical protein
LFIPVWTSESSILNQGIFILWKLSICQGGGGFSSSFYICLDKQAFSGAWPEKGGPLGIFVTPSGATFLMGGGELLSRLFTRKSQWPAFFGPWLALAGLSDLQW